MENQLFELKFSAKQLRSTSLKFEKESKNEMLKVKTALHKGNNDGARIHAENAIRNKNSALSFLKMSARVDAVASRVQTAVHTQAFTKNIASVVRSMQSASRSMNLQKVMDQTLGNSTALSTPENDVDNLMKQLADEAGIELKHELEGTPLSTSTLTPISHEEEDGLAQRLARLRQS